ncbi:phosphatidylinositol transfer protein [Hypoxylon argillaceum]|nr:phosphatidylinositol transfer protein [Hypoxylon argillaceum]
MKPADALATKTETGHTGTLTAEQERKLQQFWLLLLAAFASELEPDAAAPEGAPPQDPPAAGPRAGRAPAHHQVDLGQRAVTPGPLQQTWLAMLRHESPDALLLRFLRARKWDVAAAHAMLLAALAWRRGNGDLFSRGEAWCAARERNGTEAEKKEGGEFLAQHRLGKVYLRGVDRRGRPVGYVHVAAHKPGMQSQATIRRLVVQMIETARCLFSGPPCEAFSVVFDLTGFSLSNMEWQPVSFIIQAFEANYPECLGSLLIHNAPWIFSGVWKIIRPLLDPVVASKVDFTRSLADLEKYIPKENIISRIGGADAWRYAYVEPAEDEDAGMALGDEREAIEAERREIAGRFLAATQAWIKHVDAGEREDAAVQAELRSTEIEVLRIHSWRLDPYVRSRTNLDRTGVIGPGGVIEFYPDRKDAAEKEEIDAQLEDSGITAHQEVAAAS